MQDLTGGRPRGVAVLCIPAAHGVGLAVGGRAFGGMERDSAGEPLQQVAEVPGVLDDSGACAGADRAGAAAVVALDGPDRQQGEAVVPGEAEDLRGVRQAGDLGLAP
jgi:hypothetical protein